jgi:hypothetical protein
MTKWSFKEEKEGLCFGNIDGHMVPLTPESRRVAREMSLGEILFGEKLEYTQKDYEEIEEYFSTYKGK